MALRKQCPCCKSNYIMGTLIQDTEVCNSCASMLLYPQSTNLATVRKYYTINMQRALKFKKTSTIKLPLTEGLIIDNVNKLFYISGDNDIFPLYFRFDEVADYNIRSEGGQTVTVNKIHTDTNKNGREKTVTKRKGVLTRGLIGGAIGGIATGGLGAPIGAILGATTSKKVEMSPKGRTSTDKVETITSETKVVGAYNVLTIILDSPYGPRTFEFTKYPDSMAAFLDRCTAMYNALPAPEPAAALPEAEKSQPNETDRFTEIKKYKELLDEGIISQEEFEKKKKELLGLE